MTSAITRPDPASHRPQHADRQRGARGLTAAAERRLVTDPSWVVLMQLFIGLGWLRAAAEKIIDRDWWAGDGVSTFVAEHDGTTIGWYRPVVDVVIQPGVAIIAVVVVAAQLFAAATLLTARRVSWGLAVGAFLNLNFVLVGAVSPSVFYLLAQAALALFILEYRSGPATGVRWLGRLVTAGVWLAAAAAPMIATIDPMAVVEDPGTMLTFFGLLLAVSARLAVRRWELRQDSAGPAQVDARRYR